MRYVHAVTQYNSTTICHILEVSNTDVEGDECLTNCLVEPLSVAMKQRQCNSATAFSRALGKIWEI